MSLRPMTPKGFWVLKRKKTAEVLKLKLEKVDPRTARQVSPGRHSIEATLRDIESDDSVKMIFYLKFADSQWTVEKMRLL